MGKSEKKPDWEMIDQIARKEMAKQKSLTFEGDKLSEPTEKVVDLVKVPNDVITNFKKNKIQRAAGIEMLKEWYNGQLIVAKTYINHLVNIKSTELDIEATQVLRELNQRHLDYLGELGLRNLGHRFELLEKLNDNTSSMLAVCSEKKEDGHWSEDMVIQTIKTVLEMYNNFFGQIKNDEFGGVD